MLWRSLFSSPAIVCWIIVGSIYADHPTLEAIGQSPQDTDPRLIKRLVDQLGHDSFHKREAAHAELRTIGELAVPALEAAIRSSDAELKDRALRLRREIPSDIRARAISHFALKGIVLTEKSRSVHLLPSADIDAELNWLTHFPAVESVAVENGVVTTYGLTALARCPTLRCVSLRYTCIPREGIAPLLSLPNLELIDLSHTNVSRTSLAQLAKCKQLRRLQLAGTDFDEDALELLNGIKWLDLSETNIGRRGLKQLRGTSPTIEHLNLSRTAVNDDDLDELKDFKSLHTLVLNGTAISGFGFAHLVELPNLRRIELDQSSATDDGIMYLHKLPALRSVSFRLTDITPRGRWLLEEATKGSVDWSPRHEVYLEALDLRRDP